MDKLHSYSFFNQFFCASHNSMDAILSSAVTVQSKGHHFHVTLFMQWLTYLAMPWSALAVQEDADGFLTCPNCNEQWTQEGVRIPFLASCGHNLCGPCANDLMASSSVQNRPDGPVVVSPKLAATSGRFPTLSNAWPVTA